MGAMDRASDPRLRIELLGPVRAWSGERELDLGAPRRQAVLAVLALRANRSVSRDEIIDAVWGDAPPASAANNVQIYVGAIRRVLASGGAGDPPILRGGRSGYLLRLAPGELDVAGFDDHLHRARSGFANGEPAAAVRELDAALALWRGTPLSGVTGPFADAQRLRLGEQRLTALEDRAEAMVALGRLADGDLVAELAALVHEHPLRERLRGLLMRALHRAGRRAEALTVYTETRRLLVEELGLEPGPQLREVHRAVLSDRGPPAPPLVEPQPGGAVVPHQLPRPVRHFAGREAELKALDGLLAQGSTGGIVVASAIGGTAGVGKTALALHWAHQVAGRFPDGQLYVNLRGFDPSGPALDPAEAVHGFLDALGVPPQRIPASLEAQAGLYRSLLAGRRMLILLDNARDAGQVRPLLPGSVECLVAVTSRSQLTGLVAIEGAHPLTLDVLDRAEAGQLLAGRIGPERVTAEPEAVAEIVDACAGLPLALAIVAARAATQGHLPLAKLAAELRDSRDRLDALTGGDDPATDVRAVFSWSYQTLTPEAARLFRLIGLHPGPDVTADAAAVLADTSVPRARRLMARLTAAHLVAEHAPDRYVLHDLLRLYSAERARGTDTEAERNLATERLYDWYLRTADAAAGTRYPQMLRLPLPGTVTPAEVGFRDVTEAGDWLDSERSGMIGAIQHCAEHGPRPVAWRLADMLRGYLWQRLAVADWSTVARAALAAAEAESDPEAQASAHLSLAHLHTSQSDYPRAVEHYARMLALARQAGWMMGECAALSNLGNVYWRSGQLTEAAEQLTRALALNQENGWLGGQAGNLANLGVMYRHLGRLAEAADHYNRAVTLYRRIDAGMGEAVTLVNLGETYHDLGRLTEALDQLNRAVALHRAVGDRSGEAVALPILAAVHRDTGDHAHAADLAHQALAVARDIGELRLEADALNVIATIHHLLGRPGPALDAYKRALALARESRNRYAEGESLIGSAAAHRRLGRYDQAHACLRDALALARDASYRILEGQALTQLAAVRLAEGQPGQAIGDAREALGIHRETGHRLGAARTHLVLARALSGIDTAGANHQRQARELFAEIGAPEADHVATLLPAHHD